MLLRAAAPMEPLYNEYLGSIHNYPDFQGVQIIQIGL